MEIHHSPYQLKPLLIQDIGQAIKLSDAENWNQTKKDWSLLVRNPQNICLAAFDERKVVGTATAINYENKVAWIGMVLVDHDYRGRGISKMLLSGLFENLKACRSIKLDATPVGKPVYQKYGFKDEYLIHRMTTFSATVEILPTRTGFSPERVKSNDIPELVEYDKRVFGVKRKQLIEFLAKNDPDNVWMLKKNGRITGLVLGRKGARFHQIGPVLASNTEDAKILILKSLEKLVGRPVVVDIPDNKRELIEWLNTIGFIEQRQFIRMYQNENPYPGKSENQFLICGPEFG